MRSSSRAVSLQFRAYVSRFETLVTTRVTIRVAHRFKTFAKTCVQADIRAGTVLPIRLHISRRTPTRIRRRWLHRFLHSPLACTLRFIVLCALRSYRRSVLRVLVHGREKDAPQLLPQNVLQLVQSPAYPYFSLC